MTPSHPNTSNDDTLGSIVDDLDKYAGWLGSSARARQVRGEMRVLRTTITSGDYFDLQDSVQALVIALNRVPGGPIRQLFSNSLSVLRAVASRRHAEGTEPSDRSGPLIPR
jgi:hypothetical protein